MIISLHSYLQFAWSSDFQSQSLGDFIFIILFGKIFDSLLSELWYILRVTLAALIVT